MPKPSIAIPPLTETAAKRFWSKVAIGAEGECWEWQAGRSGFGYGRFKYAGRLFSSHRLAYFLSNGAIPLQGAYLIRHSCDNPKCCNPAHLSLGTDSDNVRDMFQRGRAPRRARRLPAEKIRAAREAVGTMRAIGAALGLSNSTVSRIKRGLIS